MNIYFYATFSNQDDFLKTLKKKIRGHSIFTKNDKIKLGNIDVALVCDFTEFLKEFKVICNQFWLKTRTTSI